MMYCIVIDNRNKVAEYKYIMRDIINNKADPGLGINTTWRLDKTPLSGACIDQLLPRGTAFPICRLYIMHFLSRTD